MPDRFDIVAFGEPMIEFCRRTAKDGDDLYLRGFGGDTANAIVAAARQGARTAMVTALGTDGFGDAFVKLWQEEGIDCAGVRRIGDAFTAAYFVDYGPDGHEFSYLRSGSAASRLGPHDLPDEVLARADMLHLSGISQAISATACDAAFRAIEIVRANGGRVSYDTNLRLALWPLARARGVIHEAMCAADIALPGLEDAVQLTGVEEPQAIVDFYLGLGPSLVALKLGADGVIVATAERRRRIAAFPVKPVDATGAGDAFDGAFLAELARGIEPFAAARYAAAAAALSTTRPGAAASIPGRSAVEAFLAEQAAAE